MPSLIDKLFANTNSSLETCNCSASIVDYKFDVGKSSWCELTLSFDIAKNMVDLSNVIRKAAAQAVVHEVSNEYFGHDCDCDWKIVIDQLGLKILIGIMS